MAIDRKGTNKISGFFNKVKEKITEKNEDSETQTIDVSKIIAKCLIRIDRNDLLRKEFSLRYDTAVTNVAVERYPLAAGVDIEQIDEITKEIIHYEKSCLTKIFATIGLTNKLLMAATIASDVLQYYNYLFRAAQKMLYFYGFPQLADSNAPQGAKAAIAVLTLTLGTMYGIDGASNAVKSIANAYAREENTELINVALAEGTLAPVVVATSNKLKSVLFREVYSGSVKKVFSIEEKKGDTPQYFAFDECLERLRCTLRDTALSNPNPSASTDIYISAVSAVPAIEG